MVSVAWFSSGRFTLARAPPRRGLWLPGQCLNQLSELPILLLRVLIALLVRELRLIVPLTGFALQLPVLLVQLGKLSITAQVQLVELVQVLKHILWE